jgi:hypothetical protein
MHTYMHTHTHTRTHTPLISFAHTRAHTNTLIHTHTHTRTQTHRQIKKHTELHIHIHTHARTITHTQKHPLHTHTYTHQPLTPLNPARLVPHSVVYAASALPMELPQNFHGQSTIKVRQLALKVRNDIHKLKNLAA